MTIRPALGQVSGTITETNRFVHGTTLMAKSKWMWPYKTHNSKGILQVMSLSHQVIKPSGELSRCPVWRKRCIQGTLPVWPEQTGKIWREYVITPIYPPNKKMDWTILTHGNSRYDDYKKFMFRSRSEQCQNLLCSESGSIHPISSLPDQTRKLLGWAGDL